MKIWQGLSSRSALLVHGVTSSADGWWRLGPDLVTAGFGRVVAPDLPGHGGTPETDDWSLEAVADQLMDESATKWDMLLGHSWGGSLVLVAHVRHPQLANRLVLEDPALIIPDIEAAKEWAGSSFDNISEEAAAAREPSWHPTDVKLKVEALTQTTREVVDAVFDGNDPWNLLALIEQISVPTLVIGAEREALVPPDLGAELERLNSLVQFVQIPNSSHSIHRDEYAPMLDAIVRFVQ